MQIVVQFVDDKASEGSFHLKRMPQVFNRLNSDLRIFIPNRARALLHYYVVP